jgi:hypothetical protein
MENIIRKPYEISLWEDRPIWHMHKLERVYNLSKDTYEPGKYYSVNGNNSAKIYTLDNTPWNANRKYYKLASNNKDNYKEDANVQELAISPEQDESWYEFFKTKDTEQDFNKIYYRKISENNYEKAEGNLNADYDWYEAALLP